MIIIKTKLIPKGYKAITIGPFIFTKRELNDEDLNHETIHWHQEREMLILPFFIWYITEFIIRWFSYYNFKLAYYNISFEREAYCHESNLSYLKNRKPFNWIKFI